MASSPCDLLPPSEAEEVPGGPHRLPPMSSHYGHCHVIDVKDIAEDSICFGGKEKEELISIKLSIFCFVSFVSLSKTNIPLYPR